MSRATPDQDAMRQNALHHYEQTHIDFRGDPPTDNPCRKTDSHTAEQSPRNKLLARTLIDLLVAFHAAALRKNDYRRAKQIEETVRLIKKGRR
jgi:hypothetical protein